MTQPTQAQIEAAAKAAWERYKGFPWPGNQELWEDAIKAAFVAAAQVEERPPHFWSGAEEVRIATIKRCAQVGEQRSIGEVIDIERELREKAVTATIERCAQVALNAELTDERHAIKVRQQIAAAIRKLKDAP